MLQLVILGLLVLANLQNVAAECANACNGHGKCTSYDMCICNRNWQAADCSERVCQFGLAHVDTPKGDLDGSGDVSAADTVVIDNSFVYPYGTTEQFPQMQDSDLQTLTDTAHYYMECSNKGRCDRTTGECACYDGYDGVACQRASCPGYPNSCSGHGVCKTIKQLAENDNGNVYELWDKHTTMGCECDAGYFGADCSQRKCKFGVDPLYLDDAATVHYSTFDFATFSTNSISTNFTYDIFDSTKPGYWAIRLYDNHLEDWVTAPIIAGATCAQVLSALESLPNKVVPSGSLECTRTKFTGANSTESKLTANEFPTFSVQYDGQHPYASKHPYKIVYELALWEARTSALYAELSPATAVTGYMNSNSSFYNNLPLQTDISLSGYIYRVKFYGNPGKLRQPEIEVYLDGDRPTLLSQHAKVITKVWTDGQQGEDNDYFADHCDGVTVTIGTSSSHGNPQKWDTFLTGITSTEKNLLKKCLGSADFNTSNNVEVYNWDYGTKLYPHLVKLVRTVTTYTDGGYYAVIYFDTATHTYTDGSGTTGVFQLVNPFYPPDNFATDNYDIYTTTGTLALTSDLAYVTFGFASNYIYTVNSSYDVNVTAGSNNYHHKYPYDGDISCEVGNNNAHKLNYIRHCLNKTDIFTLLSWDNPESNPPHINLYTATRLKTMPFEHMVKERFQYTALNTTMHYMTHVITTDIATNWAASTTYDLHHQESIGLSKFQVYKFFPAVASTYEYVAECANRGICDRDSGVCKCFPGYTSDSCAEQSSLAL